MAEYIEREALSQWCHETMKKQVNPIGMTHVRWFWNTILDFPAADVAPVVHGRWLEADDGDGIVCSVCGTDFCTLLNETEKFNGCPHCLARMDGDE